jgi:two-component sensor histidine kinase
MHINFKLLTGLLCFLLFMSIPWIGLKAQTNFVFNPSDGTISLKPYFEVLEDTENKFTAPELLNNSNRFEPIKGFKPIEQTSTFWLITRFSSAEQTEASISFNHLSFADLYLMADTSGANMIHRQAGAFRPIENIANGDSRFDFSIKMEPHTPYIILLKSRHTKKYPPVFDFYLNERYRFLETKYKRELNDLWPQGASALLLIYIFLRWVTTRHRPFIWLMLFLASFNLYGIALNRYLVDWFFPSAPYYGWLITQHFLHFGLAGLYLLLFDTWDMKHKSRKLYQWGKGFIYGLLLLTIIVFLNNYYASNFKLSAKLTIGFLMPLLVYSIIMLINMWKKLDKHELLLAYGLIFYMLVNALGSAGVLFFGEYYYTILPNITKAVSISIAFLFLMGLNGRLRQNALDKTRYLKELNLLQQHQNELLEENVSQRTRELSQRNAHIETLMNELHHRVKNNLQMLYGLNSLRLTGKNDTEAGNILRDNISRIKAMMLVNENLQLNEDERALVLKPFIESIIAHSSRIFEIEKAVHFNIDIAAALALESKLALPLGLIISELLVNSYKHAFKNTPLPEISISIDRLNSNWHISYRDNGCGMPKNMVPSFGTNLIQDLTRQIQGKLEVSSNEGLNYNFTISTL